MDLLIAAFASGVVVGMTGAILLTNWAVEREIRAVWPPPEDRDRAGEREARWHPQPLRGHWSDHWHNV